jgi:hypothetical protein
VAARLLEKLVFGVKASDPLTLGWSPRAARGVDRREPAAGVARLAAGSGDRAPGLGSGIGDRGSGIGDQGSGIGDRGSGIGDQGSGIGIRIRTSLRARRAWPGRCGG